MKETPFTLPSRTSAALLQSAPYVVVKGQNPSLAYFSTVAISLKKRGKNEHKQVPTLSFTPPLPAGEPQTSSAAG